MTFRCSAASMAGGEQLAGTAPTEGAFLFVEYSGAWSRDAPALLREHVDLPVGVRPQLIRRHRSATDGGLRVFAAWRDSDRFAVETSLLHGLTDLGDLDLAALGARRSPGLEPYDDLLWLVCTNGSRDVCCAEAGRPVAAALSEAWTDQTWETTHLGGHRFAATLLALPSGVTLGRLGPDSAVESCRELAAGRHPTSYSRGRAGRSAREQVAEIVTGLPSTGVDGDVVTLDGGGTLEVRAEDGPPRRQSCADLAQKPTTRYRAV